MAEFNEHYQLTNLTINSDEIVTNPQELFDEMELAVRQFLETSYGWHTNGDFPEIEVASLDNKIKWLLGDIICKRDGGNVLRLKIEQKIL